MRVTFLDYLIWCFFIILDIRKHNNRSHCKRKNGNLKRKKNMFVLIHIWIKGEVGAVKPV